MKRFLFATFALSTTLTVFSGFASAQQDFSKVEIKAIPVAGNVYMLTGRGGNIGASVGDDGILIVDDQYGPLADKIKAAVHKLGKGKIVYVLNTHYHGDHTGGNPHFGGESTIVAHENVRQRLATEQTLFGRKTPPMDDVGLPEITFDQSLSLHFNGEEIRALHLPHGHTDGDIVIFFTKANVVHMGDDFFNEMFPFVDLDHGGDVEGLIHNVEAVLGMVEKDAKIIPGHGPLTGVAGLKTYHRMLVETTDVVRGAIADGKTLEQIKSAGVPKKWQSWGTGFIKTDKWLETIHTSLSR